ncbi:MAG TPA: GNAT family N-acetyltransferase [Candidatus Dormibacteraeota bacterium]
MIPLDPPSLVEAPDLLETERLLLRQFLETDVDLYARICADPEVMRYIGDGSTLTREETWRSVAGALGHWVLRGYGLYAVEEKATGTFIGRIGLINPEGWPGLEAGWLLGRQQWGRGYATEGAKAVVRMAYESVAATHLISLIRPDNLASIRVAEKLGAIRESTIEMSGGPAHIYAYGGPPVDPTLLLAPHSA